MKINSLKDLATFLRQLDPHQGECLRRGDHALRVGFDMTIDFSDFKEPPPASHKPWHELQNAYEAGKSKRRGRPKGRHSRNKSGLGKSM